MKKANKHILLFLFVLFCTKALQAEQKLIQQTDKNIYVAGESIGFKCSGIEHSSENNATLFVDLCGEGYSISSQVIKSKNEHWEGFLEIPDTVQTGVYLLRFYKGNESGIPTITTKPVAVFNRFGKNELNEIRKSRTAYAPLNFSNFEIKEESKALKVTAQQNKFKPLEEIGFQIKTNIQNPKGGISLSVFKIPDEQVFDQTVQNREYNDYDSNDNIKIYNELYLCGLILNDSSKQPVINETVLLSFPDSIPGINYTQTNNKGEFKFLMRNNCGQLDAIVQTLNKAENYDVEIFPTHLLPPASIPFYITKEIDESQFVNLAIKRATFNKAYQTPKSTVETRKGNKFPFYGLTSNRVYPNQYVSLIDFEEIVWEILPIVKYRKEKNNVSIKLWDNQSQQLYEKPWILVDGIPVFDALSLKVLNSDKISWIDIQAQLRCYGNLMLEGALMIQTYKGDFSDIILPKNTVRQTINSYKTNNIDNISTSNTEQFFKDILIWQAELNTKNGEDIMVKASYEKGKYVALAQLIDERGMTQTSAFTFTIE